LDGNSVSGRAATVATANGFTDNTTPHPGTSQSVAVAPTSNSVTVTVSQTQPTMLASVVGMKTATVVARATATVTQAQPVCMLGLNQNDGGAVTIGGNSSISGAGCSIMSDGGMKLSSPPTLSPGTQLLSAHGCKSPSCSQIGSTGTFSMPVASNPLASFDQPGAVPAGTGGSNPHGSTLTVILQFRARSTMPQGTSWAATTHIAVMTVGTCKALSLRRLAKRSSMALAGPSSATEPAHLALLEIPCHFTCSPRPNSGKIGAHLRRA
jgi:hypothetical protein